VTEAFVTAALARFPDEPRLLLAKAFLLDRRQPFASGEATATTAIVPQLAGTAVIPGRVSFTTGLPANHVRDVSAAYDKAIASEDASAEARIRKSLLLLRAERAQEALALLDSAGAQTPDSGLQYFRDLFRGRVLTALDNVEAAEAAYRAALALAPQAQSPRVALMALALHRGDRAAATLLAEEIQAAPAGAWDPWWNYWQGDYRLAANTLARKRAQTR
jgi:tetratricopeptide (TPR) repeat protein